MGRRERLAYLKQIYDRYHRAGRKEKKVILDEFTAVCEYDRKHAIRLLSKKPKTRVRKKAGRKPVYKTPCVEKFIRTVWLMADQPCSKRLKSDLPEWHQHTKKNMVIYPLKIEKNP